MKGVHDVIAGITGFNEQRGDLITVETLPFEGTLAIEPPPAPPSQTHPKLVLDYKQPAVIGIAVVILLLILAVVFLLLRRAKRSKTAAVADTAPGALPAGDSVAVAAVAGQPQDEYEQKMIDNDAERAQLEAEALSRIKLPANTKKTEVLVRFIRESVLKDPVAATNVLRTWVTDGEGKKSV
jgi:flagellar M-ring protein FliF